MGSKMKYISASLLALTVVFTAWAEDIPPTPKRLVNDYADVLTSSQENSLENKLVAYDDSTSTQIAVVTIQSLDRDDLFDYSQRLAEGWGIGGGANSNGVLLLVSVDDRKIRIHTGYGTEGAIPDAIAKRIIENEIKPHFRNGDYYAGFDDATDAMILALRGEYKAGPKKKERNVFGIIPFIILLLLFFLFLRRRKYTGYSHSGRRFYGTPWIGGFGGGSSWGGGGSSFGGGGGFGGFGGGGFGGGGASGGW